MASPADALSATGGGVRDVNPRDLGDFFDLLDLEGEEFEDLVVDEDDPKINDSVRWLALARVHTAKNFSQAIFFRDMHATWNTAQQVRFRPVGKNLFMVQASCLGDWERIMEKGPWLFRNLDVLLQPYDGFSKTEEIEIFHMPIWLQIHKLPDGYCKNNLVEKLIKKAGEVFAVRYEKLAKFCKFCGRIGHDFKECGTGIHAANDLRFGDWLYADPPNFTQPMGGARASAQRSPMPGGVPEAGKKGDDLKDTTTSPLMTPGIIAMNVDMNSRKRLNVDEKETINATLVNDASRPLLLSNKPYAEGDVLSPTSSQDSKCAKIDDVSEGKSNTLADPLVGCRRAQ
ncbi:hypothetical protein VPH35_103581 [Triticum aestivum]